MMNPPAIHGPAKAGVQRAAATKPAAGARFGSLNRVAAKTTMNPVNMMPKAPVDMSVMKGPMMNMGKSVPVSSPATSAASTSGSALSKALPYAPKALGVAGRAAGLAPGAAVLGNMGYHAAKDITNIATGRKEPSQMAQAYKQGHSSFVQHPTTPGVKTSDVFARMRQMKPTEADKAQAAKAEPAPAPSSTAQSFKQAFAAARKEAGGSRGQFTYKDKQYQTNLNPAKGAEKYIPSSQQKVTSVGKTAPAATTASSSSTTPGSASIKAQPAPPASATAGMSSAAEKSGISQTPTKPGTEFGAGKSLAPLPTASTPASKPAEAPLQNPDQNITKSQPPLPSMAQPGGGASNDTNAGLSKMDAMPKAEPSPSNGSGSVKYKDAGTATNKMVAETVQVGNYKYRII